MAEIRRKFDELKEDVDDDLGFFAGYLVTTLESTPESNKELRVGLEDLLLEARQWETMSASEFWVKCEGVVQKLDDKRKELPMEGLRQAHNRLLFILTRCTRLVHLYKESGYYVEEHILGMHQRSDLGVHQELMAELMVKIQKINENQTLAGKQDHLDQDSSSGAVGVEVNTARSTDSASSNSMICRICEVEIPVVHVEEHSRICTIADRCDLKGMNVNLRLERVAESLDRILKSWMRKEESRICTIKKK